MQAQQATDVPGVTIVCTGPWLPQLMGGRLSRRLVVRRQALHWFATTPPRQRLRARLVPPRATRCIGFRLPDGCAAGAVKAAACLYTNAPDANFLIDRLADFAAVIVVSACSGHGFKHSAAIGEAVAEMAIGGSTPAVLRAFSA